jgi:Arc/MetJ family transcription regulator
VAGIRVTQKQAALDLDSIIGLLRSRKTTIDLPEDELAEAMKHTKAKTKTEAVSRAVAEYNRRERLAKLAEKLGTFRDLMTPEELRKMREME